jgi:Ca2+-binding RTX toxin-like protein
MSTRKGISMMRSSLGGEHVVRRSTGSRRASGPAPRRFEAKLESLESRGLLAGGSVAQVGALVTITPASSGPNVAVVSFAPVNGTQMLDVNLNGTNNYFSTAQVGFVYYMGSGISAAQTFENTTTLHTVAWGGSGANLFVGGPGSDEFIGGTGLNVFDAGTGFDELVGGLGVNVFNENAAGSGMIEEIGTQNSVNALPASGSYQVL